MRVYLLVFSTLLFFLASCKDQEKAQQEHTLRAQQHTDSVFSLLEEKWNFRIPAVSKKVDAEIAEWSQWSDFKKEIKLKPVASISAFQKKIDKLNTAATALQYNIPTNLDKPEIRARVTVLTNTFNNLQMYLNVQPIPYQEIETLLPQVNKQLISMVQKMEELLIKKDIPKEIGEEEMLRALDTLRHANPNFRITN